MAKSLTPVLVVRLPWVRSDEHSIVAINSMAAGIATKDRADFIRRGVVGRRISGGSGKFQLDALLAPVSFELTVVEQKLCSELSRLAAMQYRFSDVGSQEAQPEHTREVRRTDTGLEAQFDDRLAPAGHEHVTELPGLADESEKAAVWLLLLGASGTLNQEPRFHAAAPHRGGY